MRADVGEQDCTQYWPVGKVKETYGLVVVQTKHVASKAGYTITTLTLGHPVSRTKSFA